MAAPTHADTAVATAGLTAELQDAQREFRHCARQALLTKWKQFQKQYVNKGMTDALRNPVRYMVDRTESSFNQGATYAPLHVIEKDNFRTPNPNLVSVASIIIFSALPYTRPEGELLFPPLAII